MTGHWSYIEGTRAGTRDVRAPFACSRTLRGARTRKRCANGSEAAIRHLVGRIVESVRAKDLDALRRCYATDVVSFDVEPPLQHAGVAAKLSNWERVFAVFEHLRYEIRDLVLAVGPDLAFGHCFGRIAGTLGDGTATNGMWVRATFCFQRVDGVWLVAHDHASVPFDVRTGRGVADLKP